jgi:hypothetical protein
MQEWPVATLLDHGADPNLLVAGIGVTTLRITRTAIWIPALMRHSGVQQVNERLNQLPLRKASINAAPDPPTCWRRFRHLPIAYSAVTAALLATPETPSLARQIRR